MTSIRELARKHDVPVTVTGFGTAFALHFTSRPSLTHYRDTFEDDGALLRKFLLCALRRNVQMVADGRMYVSAAHTDEDIAETVRNLDAAFGDFRRADLS